MSEVEREMSPLTIGQQREVSERAQEIVDDIYEKHNLLGDPPKVSPGLVSAVLQATEEVVGERII